MSEAISESQIEEFVNAWFLALDQHVPTAEISKLVDDNVQMIFPEKTLHGMGDFQAWYAGGTYSDGEQAPGVINIFFDEEHYLGSLDSQIDGDQVKVRVVVGWQASSFIPPAAKSRRVAMDATQDWTLVKSDKNPHGLIITSYNAMAEPIKYAPGFARL